MNDESGVKRPDRRVTRTRRLLREAFFDLILEKGYDAVTVEDITTRADLGRTTFYLHYRDKDQLLFESFEVIAEDLLAQISSQREPAAGEPARLLPVFEDPAIPIQLVFHHAAENASLYRILMRSEAAKKASSRISALIAQVAGDSLKHRLQNLPLRVEPQVPLDVFSAYFAWALLGMVTWWLESGMPYPPEEMAIMFRKLFFLGAPQAMGIPQPKGGSLLALY